MRVTTGFSQERTRAQRGWTLSREARSFAQEERRKANRQRGNMRQSFSRFWSCTKQLDVNQGNPTRIHKLRDGFWENNVYSGRNFDHVTSLILCARNNLSLSLVLYLLKASTTFQLRRHWRCRRVVDLKFPYFLSWKPWILHNFLSFCLFPVLTWTKDFRFSSFAFLARTKKATPIGT